MFLATTATGLFNPVYKCNRLCSWRVWNGIYLSVGQGIQYHGCYEY